MRLLYAGLLPVAGPSRLALGQRPRLSRGYSSPRVLRVLGLESSADDSCAAIVTSDRQVLSNVVIKQHDINKKNGGIHPIEAQEAHMCNIPLAIQRALEDTGLKITDLDGIGYTRGPGMMGCLSVGASSAKALSVASGVPLIGVNHMQAHALTPLLTEHEPPQFPFLTLLVSGGHTQLVLAEGIEKYQIILDTMDNAMGAAYDRIAKRLELPMSPDRGFGPVLEDYAAAPPLEPYDTAPLNPLPLPLRQNRVKGFMAFTFSGLYSASARLAAQEFPNNTKVHKRAIPENVQREISRIFQTAAVGHVVDKVGDAIKQLESPVTGLVISGGVGSNQYLRQELRAMLLNLDMPYPIPLRYPPVAMCTDNAAMIAWVAISRLQKGLTSDPFTLPLRRKWPLDHNIYDDVPSSCYEKV